MWYEELAAKPKKYLNTVEQKNKMPSLSSFVLVKHYQRNTGRGRDGEMEKNVPGRHIHRERPIKKTWVPSLGAADADSCCCRRLLLLRLSVAKRCFYKHRTRTLNAFTTGSPFGGTILFEISIGKDFGVLKGHRWTARPPSILPWSVSHF